MQVASAEVVPPPRQNPLLYTVCSPSQVLFRKQMLALAHDGVCSASASAACKCGGSGRWRGLCSLLSKQNFATVSPHRFTV